jgi:Flp pilus assembly protein TadG
VNPLAALAPRAQRGAYAVEFALVFSIFFLVLYGLITYGLIFTAQHSLNLAADDGARAALRWQPPEQSLLRRAAVAHATAVDRAAWIDAMAGTGVLEVAVCDANGRLRGNGACSGEPVPQQALEVVVRYPYAQAPLVPMLDGGVLGGLFVPRVLASRATVGIASGGGL